MCLSRALALTLVLSLPAFTARADEVVVVTATAPGTDGRALPLTFSGPQGEA